MRAYFFEAFQGLLLCKNGATRQAHLRKAPISPADVPVLSGPGGVQLMVKLQVRPHLATGE